MSAFSRRQREGNLSADQFNQLTKDFREDFETQYRVIDVDSSLIKQAGELVMSYPLRAYDALQLASALYVRSLISAIPDTPLIFVSADSRLLNIAQSEGLTIDNPNSYS